MKVIGEALPKHVSVEINAKDELEEDMRPYEGSRLAMDLCAWLDSKGYNARTWYDAAAQRTFVAGDRKQWLPPQ